MTTLTVGSIAPQFSLADVEGRIVSIDDNANKFLLVAFLRYSGCPWCNLAIHRLVFEQPILADSNCKIVTFVQSSKENIVKNIYERHQKPPQFPVIPDQKMNIYKKYGVIPSLTKSVSLIREVPHWVHAVRDKGFGNKNVDGSLFLAPALFLLAPHSREIVLTEYPANLFEHSTFSRVYDAIFAHPIRGAK